MVKIVKRKPNQEVEPCQLPSDEEIRAAHREGEEAVVALFCGTAGVLAARIQALEDRIS